ncbi:MAG: DUF2865 domain-containing protein [Methylocystis sp.]
MLKTYFDWTDTTGEFRATARRLSRAFGVVAAIALSSSSARAESAYCGELKDQIAQADGANSGRFRAAAAKQENELARTAAYARSIGCERQQFLIFGEAPPAQCGQINARIAQMRSNLAYLERHLGDDGRKQALTARYDAQCRSRPRTTPAGVPPSETPSSFFENLFGPAPPREAGAPPDPPPLKRAGPIRGDTDDSADDPERSESEDNHAGGSLAICVRQCDGGFFPVSYSARRANLDELASLCKALCPNAEVTLYTKSTWGELSSAVSVDGDSYADHPNALKFQKTLVPACGCKPPDKSWAEALADAERILAASNSKDVVVTEEQAELLSRPAAAAAEKRDHGGARKQSTRRDSPTPDATTGSITTPITGQSQGETRETVGPDGVKRRVRVVAPTL